MKEIISRLDKIASELELKGLIKEAYAVDVVSDTIEKEASLSNLLNAFKKIPGFSEIAKYVDFKNIKGSLASLSKMLGGKMDQDTFNQGRDLLSKIMGKSNAQPDLKEASVFDIMRAGKKAVMAAVLIAMVGATLGKAYGDVTTSDVNNNMSKSNQEQTIKPTPGGDQAPATLLELADKIPDKLGPILKAHLTTEHDIGGNIQVTFTNNAKTVSDTVGIDIDQSLIKSISNVLSQYSPTAAENIMTSSIYKSLMSPSTTLSEDMSKYSLDNNNVKFLTKAFAKDFVKRYVSQEAQTKS